MLTFLPSPALAQIDMRVVSWTGQMIPGRETAVTTFRGGALTEAREVVIRERDTFFSELSGSLETLLPREVSGGSTLPDGRGIARPNEIHYRQRGVYFVTSVGSRSAVVRYTGLEYSVLAEEGTPAPGGGVFGPLPYMFANETNDVAFLEMQGTTTRVWRILDGGSPTLAGTSVDPILQPTPTSVLVSFNLLGISPRGQVVVNAVVDDTAFDEPGVGGVFAAVGGSLMPILITGQTDPVFGREVCGAGGATVGRGGHMLLGATLKREEAMDCGSSILDDAIYAANADGGFTALLGPSGGIVEEHGLGLLDLAPDGRMLMIGERLTPPPELRRITSLWLVEGGSPAMLLEEDQSFGGGVVGPAPWEGAIAGGRVYATVPIGGRRSVVYLGGGGSGVALQAGQMMEVNGAMREIQIPSGPTTSDQTNAMGHGTAFVHFTDRTQAFVVMGQSASPTSGSGVEATLGGRRRPQGAQADFTPRDTVEFGPSSIEAAFDLGVEAVGAPLDEVRALGMFSEPVLPGAITADPAEACSWVIAGDSATGFECSYRFALGLEPGSGRMATFAFEPRPEGYREDRLTATVTVTGEGVDGAPVAAAPVVADMQLAVADVSIAVGAEPSIVVENRGPGAAVVEVVTTIPGAVFADMRCRTTSGISGATCAGPLLAPGERVSFALTRQPHRTESAAVHCVPLGDRLGAVDPDLSNNRVGYALPPPSGERCSAGTSASSERASPLSVLALAAALAVALRRRQRGSTGRHHRGPQTDSPSA